MNSTTGPTPAELPAPPDGGGVSVDGDLIVITLPSPLVIVVSIISATTNSASGESHFGASAVTAVGSGGDFDCCAAVSALVAGGGRWISAAQRCG